MENKLDSVVSEKGLARDWVNTWEGNFMGDLVPRYRLSSMLG